MFEFILVPVEISESSVTFQLLVSSPTRKRGFSANCVMTLEEFKSFRNILIKGVRKSKRRSVVIHPQLKTLK